MGTISSIACKTCKVTRDLDKLYGVYSVSDRKEALKYSEKLEAKDNLFRIGLLLSFMAEHMTHDVVYFDEHCDCVEELDPFYDNEFKKDTDFWKED